MTRRPPSPCLRSLARCCRCCARRCSRPPRRRPSRCAPCKHDDGRRHAPAAAHEYAGRGAGPRRVAAGLSRRPARSRSARPNSATRCKAGQVLAQLDPQDYQLGAGRRARAAGSGARPTATWPRPTSSATANCATRASSAAPSSSAARPRCKAAQAQLEQARRSSRRRATRPATRRWWPMSPASSPAVEAEPGQVVAAGTPVRAHRAGRRRATWCSRCPEDQVAAASSRLGESRCAAVRVWARRDADAGEVREVAASADPVTRTYTVKADARRARRARARRDRLRRGRRRCARPARR